MLKNILELKGAQELSKNQQKAVNGGKKCKSTILIPDELDMLSGGNTCLVQCRPSFLGIGFGSWDDGVEQPC